MTRSTPMRITFVLPETNLSGGNKVVLIYAKLLSRMGHRVVVIAGAPRRKPLRQRLRTWLKSSRTPPHAEPPVVVEADGFDYRTLSKQRPPDDASVPDADVVVATWWETAEWILRMRASKGAKVHFVQGHEVFDYLPRQRTQAVYRLPMHRIVVARWLQELLRERYGDGATDLVPNSVDRTQFNAPERGRQHVPTLGFLYHPSPLKGVDITLGAIARLKARHPEMRVVAFGGSLPVEQVALPDWISFHYRPTPPAIRDLYAQCDVWVTASRSEGFNLPAMEAMACRTPVVSTATGWPAEAIRSEENGMLVDIDDELSLTNAVERILLLPDAEWRRMSAAALATVGDTSWERSATLFEAALQRARERNARGELSAMNV